MYSAAAIATLLFISSCRTSERFDWRETYYHESKQPYGTYVMRQLLDNYNGNASLEAIDGPLHLRFAQTEFKTPSNYIFIGQHLYLGEEGTKSLLAYVGEGNNAFISAKELPAGLNHELRNLGCSYNDSSSIIAGVYESNVVLNFYHPDIESNQGYSYAYAERNVPYSTKWRYISTNNLCDSSGSLVYIGYMGRKLPNFIKIPYGKGNFFIHTTPIAFTNYYLVNERGLKYANKVFAHLGPGNVYWDEFSHLPADEEDGRKRRTPLQYILAQPSLKWAWYIILALAIVFVIFRSKRKQRVIPVMAENENTSLEFVQTIGTLYFQQNEHKKLAHQKMKLFLQHIRHRYNISTNHINHDLLRKISVKAQVPYENVDQIFETYSWIDGQPDISDENLIKFHRSIDIFYKTAK